MSKVFITETILRDAHQSLIATRMRTEDMLPACKQLDAIGYWSLEAWGGATFDACIRFLKEDPWQRLRDLKKALPNTPLQMLLRGQNLLGYRHYSDDVVRAFVKRCAENGMDVFRIFDALNDTRNCRVSIEAVKQAGKHAQGTLCYTQSPVHTPKGFVDNAKELVNMGCDSIVVKDMAGLLTPTSAYELFSELSDALDVGLHLHSHSTAGLAEMCQLKAIEAGATHIDTAISSFSGGTSHPATESMVAALKNTEFETGLNLEDLQEIDVYFSAVRKKYAAFESDFTGIDTRVQVNQVPGGMISNLANQLKQQGILDRMEEVLDEIPRVRKDMGYPPLVTPTSQIVGTQAVMNVVTGERYKTITNETKLYFEGRYGLTPAKVNPEICKKAIGDTQVVDVRPADLLKDELEDMKKSAGDLAESVDDVLIVAMFPDIGYDFLQQRHDNTLVPEPLLPASSNKEKISAATEFKITVHGESYDIKVMGTGHEDNKNRPFFLTVDGMPEEAMVETIHEIPFNSQSGSTNQPRASKPGDVTASMPCTIVEVMVKEGDEVNAGDDLLVTEAMKMETAIQAPVSGTILRVNISKGDTVNPDDALIEIS